MNIHSHTSLPRSHSYLDSDRQMPDLDIQFARSRSQYSSAYCTVTLSELQAFVNARDSDPVILRYRQQLTIIVRRPRRYTSPSLTS